MNRRKLPVYALLASLLWTASVEAQEMTRFDRDRILTMWDVVAKDVAKQYYDPKMHGVDWDATIAATRAKITTSPSMNMAMAHIAQALISLNDSHTMFIPPGRPYTLDYGYQAMNIGEQCFVVRVRPKSDAAAKGIKPGDELVSLNGYIPDRDNFWKMEYRYKMLRPVPMLHLAVRDGPGATQTHEVDVRTTYKEISHPDMFIWDYMNAVAARQRPQKVQWADLADGVQAVKLPSFMLDELRVQEIIERARKGTALVLDLRENPGGSIEALQKLVGGMFDHDVKLFDRVMRSGSKPEVVKSIHRYAFTGKLAVLVDSGSASAAELFARAVQLEKRGVVVGDRTSGSVMEAKIHTYKEGADFQIFYAAEITEADLVMTDGKSLEHVGVTPDEVVLPTAADLAAGRDPVLSRAAEQLGAKLNAEDAGKLFPYEWPKE